MPANVLPELPPYMRYTTLTDAHGRPTSTGIVELPLTYSGPSIPLAWPWIPAGELATMSSIPVRLLGNGETLWAAKPTPTTSASASTSPRRVALNLVRPTALAQVVQAEAAAAAVINQAIDGDPTDEAVVVVTVTETSTAGSTPTSRVRASPVASSSQSGALPVGVVRPTGLPIILPDGTLSTVPAVIISLPGAGETIILGGNAPPSRSASSGSGSASTSASATSALMTTLPNGSIVPVTILTLSDGSEMTVPLARSSARTGSAFLITPSSSSSSGYFASPTANADDGSGLSTGQIIGIVLGALSFFLMLMACLGSIILFRRRRRLSRERRGLRDDTSWQQIGEYEDDPDMAESGAGGVLVPYRDRPEDEGREQTGSSGRTPATGSSGFSRGGRTSGSDSPAAGAPFLGGAPPRTSGSTHDPRGSPDLSTLFYSVPTTRAGPHSGRPHTVAGAPLLYKERPRDDDVPLYGVSEFGQRDRRGYTSLSRKDLPAPPGLAPSPEPGNDGRSPHETATTAYSGLRSNDVTESTGLTSEPARSTRIAALGVAGRASQPPGLSPIPGTSRSGSGEGYTSADSSAPGGTGLATRVLSGLGLAALFKAQATQGVASPRIPTSTKFDNKMVRPVTASAVGGTPKLVEDSPTLGYTQPDSPDLSEAYHDDEDVKVAGAEPMGRKRSTSDDEADESEGSTTDDENAAFLGAKHAGSARPRWSHATLGQRVRQTSPSSPVRSFAASVRSVTHAGSPTSSPVNSRSSRRTASEGRATASSLRSRSNRTRNSSSNGTHSQSASSGSRRAQSRSEEAPALPPPIIFDD